LYLKGFSSFDVTKERDKVGAQWLAVFAIFSIVMDGISPE
jgi:hypothetical protein